MSEELRSEADLSDPAVLAAECRMMAQGMESQAEAVTMATANAGHPYPDQLYRRAAALFLACAARLTPQPAAAASAPPPPAENPPTNEPAKPADQAPSAGTAPKTRR